MNLSDLVIGGQVAPTPELLKAAQSGEGGSMKVRMEGNEMGSSTVAETVIRVGHDCQQGPAANDASSRILGVWKELG